MTDTAPETILDTGFSSPEAVATPWATAREALERARISWLTTVRRDGRPHVTPLLTIWLDDALYFSTGAEERKALNLAQNARCILTTGCNTMDAGLDLVVEGEAVPVRDMARLERLAERYRTKYKWRYVARDGALHGDAGNVAQVYAVVPAKVFAFGKGDVFSQTRYRF